MPCLAWLQLLIQLFTLPARAVAPPFEAAEQLKQAMPPEQRQWLADVEAMQAAFRWGASQMPVLGGCGWHAGKRLCARIMRAALGKIEKKEEYAMGVD